MKYYLIAGEASGDLHASSLMRSLKEVDREADFRFFGGDLMSAEGGFRVKHYRDMAYMGFIPVLLHLKTIFKNMSICKRDIEEWNPDAVILVDYPGFNLKIAKHVHSKLGIPVYYYISPKIWAWKEYRIKNIRRDVDELFSILPFEVDFYEKKHHYPIHYVGNPTADEVSVFHARYQETMDEFTDRHGGLDGTRRPIIALLAGSRKQEIKDNLPAMIEAAKEIDGYQLVVAGAPSIDDEYYEKFIAGSGVSLVRNDTYALLEQSTAALVTSGTATLETALFGVPQVVCYETPLPALIGFLRKHLLKVKYVSLVNLIADEEVVTELVAEKFSVANIREELVRLLPNAADGHREKMIQGYEKVRRFLGSEKASENAARQIYDLLHREA